MGTLAADTISLNNTTDLIVYFDKFLSILYNSDVRFRNKVEEFRGVKFNRFKTKEQITLYGSIADSLDDIIAATQTIFERRHTIVHDLSFSRDAAKRKDWFKKSEIDHLMGQCTGLLLLFESLFEHKFVEDTGWKDSVAHREELHYSALRDQEEALFAQLSSAKPGLEPALATMNKRYRSVLRAAKSLVDKASGQSLSISPELARTFVRSYFALSRQVLLDATLFSDSPAVSGRSRKRKVHKPP